MTTMTLYSDTDNWADFDKRACPVALYTITEFENFDDEDKATFCIARQVVINQGDHAPAHTVWFSHQGIFDNTWFPAIYPDDEHERFANLPTYRWSIEVFEHDRSELRRAVLNGTARFKGA